MKIVNKTDNLQNVVDYSVVVTSRVKLVVVLCHEQNHNITAGLHTSVIRCKPVVPALFQLTEHLEVMSSSLQNTFRI